MNKYFVSLSYISWLSTIYGSTHLATISLENNVIMVKTVEQDNVPDQLLAGVALLIVLIGLSYKSYMIKRKANAERKKHSDEMDIRNKTLRQLFSEREWLVNEIHHRVKNNLQIVISLLNSQFLTIKNAAAKDALLKSQQRMYAISLIHQRLYQNDEFSGINIASYINDLTSYLQDSLGDKDLIVFNLDIEPLIMDIDDAVPLGIILNEAITNSINYRHHWQQTIVAISIKKIGKQIAIDIVDNGEGLPANFDPAKTKSLGMKLITGLTNQLKGNIEFSNDNGLRIKILIPVNAPYSEE